MSTYTTVPVCIHSKYRYNQEICDVHIVIITTAYSTKYIVVELK